MATYLSSSYCFLSIEHDLSFFASLQQYACCDILVYTYFITYLKRLHLSTMNKASDIGINSEAARTIQDAGSEFQLPGESRDELRGLTRDEWMKKFGEVLASEQFFHDKDPNWVENRESWWYTEVGRAGEEPPLWMRKQVCGGLTDPRREPIYQPNSHVLFIHDTSMHTPI